MLDFLNPNLKTLTKRLLTLMRYRYLKVILDFFGADYSTIAPLFMVFDHAKMFFNPWAYTEMFENEEKGWIFSALQAHSHVMESGVIQIEEASVVTICLKDAVLCGAAVVMSWSVTMQMAYYDYGYDSNTYLADGLLAYMEEVAVTMVATTFASLAMLSAIVQPYIIAEAGLINMLARIPFASEDGGEINGFKEAHPEIFEDILQETMRYYDWPATEAIDQKLINHFSPHFVAPESVAGDLLAVAAAVGSVFPCFSARKPEDAAAGDVETGAGDEASAESDGGAKPEELAVEAPAAASGSWF